MTVNADEKIVHAHLYEVIFTDEQIIHVVASDPANALRKAEKWLETERNYSGRPTLLSLTKKYDIAA